MIVPLAREAQWRPMLDGLPGWQPALKPTVVVSPHPDDETLGAGGLIASLRARQVAVSVVAVTDGENAYEPLVRGLRETREREQAAALRCLGVGAEGIARLRMTDSGLGPLEGRLREELRGQFPAGSHVVAPWPGDFHPDHEVCGRAAEAVARSLGLQLTFYLFWTWHRGTPELLRNLPLVRFDLTPTEQLAKREALRCHESQLHRKNGAPILPEDLLDPAYRPFEVFLPV